MATVNAPAAARVATVLGPIDGARPPWGDPGPAAAAAGYLVEEYQLEGKTVAYRPEAGTRLGPDGRWQAVIDGEAGYRTRILVVRPQDPIHFNGTVLLNWQNVSGGAEPGAPRGGETYRGYAWVGVSAQEIGLYGFPAGMGRRTGGSGWNLPLVDHDPSRYGELYHPGDQGSFDIFSQAAQAVGPRRDGVVDPLGGLPVRRVLATGGSQSAMRLVAYINAVQPLSEAVDGFLLSVWEGRAPALQDGPVSYGGLRTTVRDDVVVPVMIVNSEFEVLGTHAAGVASSKMVRVWEVAGAPHGVARSRGEAGARPGEETGWIRNSLSIAPVYDSAIRHAHRWLVDGTAPPAPSRIEIVTGDRASGQRSSVHRDTLGNSVGGSVYPSWRSPPPSIGGCRLAPVAPRCSGRPAHSATRSCDPSIGHDPSSWSSGARRWTICASPGRFWPRMYRR